MSYPTLLLALLLSAAPLAAQSLPLHRPLNPLASSRSGLGVQPYVDYSPFGDRIGVAVEYGNAIDYDLPDGVPAVYLLDAELMRTSVSYTRDLGPGRFLLAQVGVVGRYDGFADGFFAWYHDLIGYRQPEREARPMNSFAGEINLPDGTQVTLERQAVALGDLQAMLGFRHSLTQQTTLGVALPSGLGGNGIGRRTIALSAIHAVRLEPAPGITLESSLGAGLAPRQGRLAAWQRVFGMSGSAGLRIRLWGGQSIYGYLFGHTAYYRDTGLLSLDRAELTGDFGWISRDRRGGEWRVGFSEDLEPGDPGIDLILKISRTTSLSRSGTERPPSARTGTPAPSAPAGSAHSD